MPNAALIASKSNSMPTVWPSGAACVSAAVPVTVDAPGLFSTTIGWPSDFSR